MPVDPTLRITIDRTGMTGSPAAFVMSATAGEATLGISYYTEPALQPRTREAPTADDVDAETTLAWSWQESVLNWNVITDGLSSETAARALIEELRAAITRLAVPTTVEVADAPGELWRGKIGTLTPIGSRTFANLGDFNAEWSVALRIHPVRSYV